MTEQQAGWMFRLGLLSLLVPVMGPVVWLSAERALRTETDAHASSRLRPARVLAIVSTCVLLGVVAFVVLGGEPVQPVQPVEPPN